MNITATFPETNPTETHDETMQRHMEVMESPDPVPHELGEALKAARARKVAADEHLSAAQADVEGKKALVAQYQGDVDEAAAAIERNENLDAAETLADRQRVAVARHKACENMQRRSANARDLAQAEVDSAGQALEKAAAAVLDVQAVSMATQILRSLEEAVRLGNQLQEYVRDELDTPLDQLNRAKPLRPVQRALEQLAKLQPDGIYQPIGESETNMAMMGLFRANTYAQRLAALVRGDLTAQDAVEKAAA